MGEAEWVSFASACEKNQQEFELFWCVYGGDGRREKKNREGRERGSGGMSQPGEKQGGRIRIYKFAYPCSLSLILVQAIQESV